MSNKNEVTLENASRNLGREVKYEPYEGCESCDCEVGHIHSVGEKYVFVQFGARTPGRGEACDPRSLFYTMSSKE